MAIKESERLKLVAARARALAIMFLTRDPRLVVEETKDDIGLDLIVRFQHKHKDGIRQFGVEIRGALTAMTQEGANKALRAKFAQMKRYGPFPFPVYLFFFTMVETQAWYSVVMEPAVVAGRATLRMIDHPDCQPLTNEAVDELTAQVDHWYDAYYSGLVTQPNGKKEKRKPEVS